MQYNDDSQEKKSFGQHVAQFFKNFWYDFTHSFKYNNMKLAAILFALPGLFIGFFISCHYEMIVNLPNTYNSYFEPQSVRARESITDEGTTFEFELKNIFIYETVNGIETSQEISATFKGLAKPKDASVNKYEGNYRATSCSISHTLNDFVDGHLELQIGSNERADGYIGGNLVYTLKDSNSAEGSKRSVGLKYKIDEESANLLHICMQDGIEAKTVVPFDFSAISIFFLMLVSILNIFVALNLSSKKNLGTVVVATISTIIMLGLSALYFFAIFTSYNAVNSGLIIDTWEWTTEKNWAMLSVIISNGFAILGLILSWINYDRTYQKVDR